MIYVKWIAIILIFGIGLSGLAALGFAIFVSLMGAGGSSGGSHGWSITPGGKALLPILYILGTIAIVFSFFSIKALIQSL